jgi:hypothetical protein
MNPKKLFFAVATALLLFAACKKEVAPIPSAKHAGTIVTDSTVDAPARRSLIKQQAQP